jgi:hypothetical protein
MTEVDENICFGLGQAHKRGRLQSVNDIPIFPS